MFSCIRVSVVMMSLHSHKTLTKTDGLTSDSVFGQRSQHGCYAPASRLEQDLLTHSTLLAVGVLKGNTDSNSPAQYSREVWDALSSSPGQPSSEACTSPQQPLPVRFLECGMWSVVPEPSILFLSLTPVIGPIMQPPQVLERRTPTKD